MWYLIVVFGVWALLTGYCDCVGWFTAVLVIVLLAVDCWWLVLFVYCGLILGLGFVNSVDLMVLLHLDRWFDGFC